MNHEATWLLMLVTLGAVVLPTVARRIALPVAIVEVLYGLLLGRSGLQVGGGSDPYLRFLADFGFALFLLVAGMEVDIDGMRRRGGRATAVSVGIACLPPVAAIAGAAWLGLSPWIGLLAGTMSVPLALTVLRDAGVLDQADGRRAFEVAALGEVVTIALVAVFEMMHHAGEEGMLAVLSGAGRLALLVAVTLLLARVMRAAAWWYPQAAHRLVADHDQQELGVRAGFGLMFLLVGMAGLGGLEPALGAFLAGLLLASVLREKGGLEHKLGSFAFGFFVPVFFIQVGMRLEITAGTLVADAPLLALVMGLMLGSRVVAAVALYLTGMPARFALSTGLLLCAPLTLFIAVAEVGAKAGAWTLQSQSSLVAAGMLMSLVAATLGRRVLPR